METEKRLILCFALSMLVIFAFQMMTAKKAKDIKPDQHQTLSVIPGQTPTQTPALQAPETTPVESPSKTEDQKPSEEETVLTAWNWLPQETLQTEPQEITVESPLYRITFSSHGGIPISWKLIQFPELLEDARYLELQSKQGDPNKQQSAQLELDLLNKHKDNGPHFVEAVDTLFPRGSAGFQVRWGSNRSDRNIPYTCSQSQIEVSEPTPVRFVYESQGMKIEKTYTFLPDSYHLELTIRIVNNAGQEITFGQDDGFYDVLWCGGFGFPSMRTDAMNNVLIQEDGDTSILPFDSVIKEIGNSGSSLLPEYRPSQTQLHYGKNINWVGTGQKYFLAAIIPQIPTNQAIKGISTPDPELRSVRKADVGIRMSVGDLTNGADDTASYKLYVGPIDEDYLIKAGDGLEESRQIFLRSVIGPIAHIMLRLLQGMYKIVPNYGFAIIALTLLMKILMFPIYQKQIRTTKKMQLLQPQINALKEKHKNDQQKLQKEQMELFKKHKVNPLSGCLTMLTTIPVFIALYATFAMAVELRGAPFIGWIQDLSAPDGAFFIPLGSYIIPINILPLAYAILMLWSTSQQAMEGPNAAAMKILPLIFVFIFWSIASGVILYFVVSIFLDVMQRIIMDKLKGDEMSPGQPVKAK